MVVVRISTVQTHFYVHTGVTVESRPDRNLQLYRVNVVGAYYDLRYGWFR